MTTLLERVQRKAARREGISHPGIDRRRGTEEEAPTVEGFIRGKVRLATGLDPDESLALIPFDLMAEWITTATGTPHTADEATAHVKGSGTVELILSTEACVLGWVWCGPRDATDPDHMLRLADPTPRRCVAKVGRLDHLNPAVAPLPWRDHVGGWTIERRQAWGDRANDLQDGGLSWREAESQAFDEVCALRRPPVLLAFSATATTKGA